MQLRIETLQQQMVEGQAVETDQIIRLSSEHRRLLTSLRSKAAKNKQAGPSVQDYIQRRYAKAEGDAS